MESCQLVPMRLRLLDFLACLFLWLLTFHIFLFMHFISSSRGYEANIDWEKGEGHPFEYCVYGAACTEVEVDCLTGDHKVTSVHHLKLKLKSRTESLSKPRRVAILLYINSIRCKGCLLWALLLIYDAAIPTALSANLFLNIVQGVNDALSDLL